MPFQVAVFDLLSNVKFAGVFGCERRLAFVVRVVHDGTSVSIGMAKPMPKICFRGDCPDSFPRDEEILAIVPPFPVFPLRPYARPVC